MDLGELVLRLDADISQLQRRLSQVEAEANDTGRRTGVSFGDSFVQGIGQAIGSRATDVVFGAFRTVPNFVKDSLRVYQEFSRSITQAGVFSNATETQLKSLSDEAKRLGAATSKSAVDVARISVELIKAGFSADEAKNALNGVVAAAEATSEEVDISGRIIQAALANFSNEFGKTREDIDELADLFSTVGNAGNLSFQGIKQGLATAGGTARAFNQTLANTLKVLGLLVDTGASNEVGATAYKNILLKLGTPDEKGSKVLEKLKINVRDSRNELRQVYDLIPEFQKAFAALDPVSRGQYAKDLFGTETVSPFLALLNATPDKLAAYSKVDRRKAAGSANKNKTELQKGLAGASEALGGSIDNLKLNLAGAFAPAYEAGTRFFQSVIDNLSASDTLFKGLKESSKEFTDLLTKDPKLSKELAIVIEGATKESLDAVTGLAKDLFEYLAKNPSAIKDTIKAVDLLARALAKVVELSAKYVTLIGSVGGLFGSLASPGQDFGFTDEQVKQRFDVLGSGLVDQNRNSKLGISGNEQLVQDTLEQLISEKRDFGSPLKITNEQVDQRALEIGDRLPLLERPFANRDDLRKQAYEQLREEQGKILLAQAKQKEPKPKDKSEEPKPKDKPVTPKSSPQKVEQAVEDVEAKTKAALDAIARAELERQLAIERLVISGAITHDQAEVRKLESTRLRIEQEIKLEQTKLAKGKFKEGETADQVKSGISSKTIELLKVQQQIEATTRDQVLSKLQKQTQLEQQKLGLANQAIAVERQKLNLYDEQLNRLKLIESSVDRQQRLKTAENNLQSSILNADIERSNLRLDDLNQARDIFKQLQGDISESQRQTLTAELGRLGLQGRIDEKSILTAINNEERAQFKLKADSLKQQQEIEKQNLGFEREKTQLQIQQNNLAAERQVKEAEFNLAQSKVDNQSRALDAQAKLKEAEIKAKGIKNKEEKKEALELVELYKQQLGLIQQQSGLVEANGQSAISIAKQNQESIAQEAGVSNKELEIKQKQLEVNQKLERDKLDAEFNKGLSRQRIGISELNDNKNSSNQVDTNKGVVGLPSISKVNNGIVTLTDGRKLTREESQALLNNSNASIPVSNKAKVNSVNVSHIPKDSLFGQSNPISSVNQTGSLGISDPNSPFFTGSNNSGKFFDKLLTSPLQNPISKPLPLPNAKALDSNVFQDKVLQQMGEIINLLKNNTPIIQNNDYTLQANNEIEVLQKARSQSINDLIGIFKGVQGIHRG